MKVQRIFQKLPYPDMYQIIEQPDRFLIDIYRIMILESDIRTVFQHLSKITEVTVDWKAQFNEILGG